MPCGSIGCHSGRCERSSLEQLARAERTNREARPVSIANSVVTRLATPATATIHSFLRHLREQVCASIQTTMDLCHALAQQGQEPQRTWVADGLLEREAAEIAWIQQHRHLLM